MAQTLSLWLLHALSGLRGAGGEGLLSSLIEHGPIEHGHSATSSELSSITFPKSVSGGQSTWQWGDGSLPSDPSMQSSSDFGEGLRIEVKLPELDEEEEERIVARGTQIFTGMIDAFLHRSNATKAELECLVANLEGVAYKGYTKSSDVATAFQEMDGRSVAGVGLLMPKLAYSLHGLLNLPKRAIENCMSGEAMEALSMAAFHMSNMTYMTGHMVANGADILNEIADAVAAIRDNEFTDFGGHLGRAGRKVLLSNCTSSSLPEGPPTEDQIVNVSAGLIQGFFGEGFELDITAEHKVSTFPLKKMMTYFHDKMKDIPVEKPEIKEDLHIHINLQSCVHKNLDFFQSVLFGAWYVFSRSAVDIVEVVELPALLTSVMHELPGALAKCGVTADKLRMLEDSVLTLQRMHVNLETPPINTSYNETIRQLHVAADHWEGMDWFAFGEDLGGMLLELVISGFPQLYSVDSRGRLQQLAPRAPGQAAVGLAARALITVLGAALVVLLAVRWRAMGRWGPPLLAGDVEKVWAGGRDGHDGPAPCGAE